MNFIKLKCLVPGFYDKHLKVWLSEFSSKSLYLIDSEIFHTKPYYYLNELQHFFGLETFIDYRKIVVFNKEKGFYCIKLKNEKVKCLGPSKGRSYSSIDDDSRRYLKQYYKKENKLLKTLLTKFGFNIPLWLKYILENVLKFNQFLKLYLK